MAYGTLTVVCGPMFAGKTTEMLKRALWARNGLERPVFVLKPAFDDRYAITEIVSHDGLRTPADSVQHLPDPSWFSIRQGDRALFILDEVQFLSEAVQPPEGSSSREMPFYGGTVDEWVRVMLQEGHDVVVGGLDMDWQGSPFPVTAALMGMADEVIKATANCTVCGRPARKTHKITAGGGSVELGSSDKYEARCNEHWRN